MAVAVQRSTSAVPKTGSAGAGWTTTPQAVDPQAMEQYEVKRQGQSRIAGREASRRHGLLHAARDCVGALPRDTKTCRHKTIFVV